MNMIDMEGLVKHAIKVADDLDIAEKGVNMLLRNKPIYEGDRRLAAIKLTRSDDGLIEVCALMVSNKNFDTIISDYMEENEPTLHGVRSELQKYPSGFFGSCGCCLIERIETVKIGKGIMLMVTMENDATHQDGSMFLTREKITNKEAAEEINKIISAGGNFHNGNGYYADRVDVVDGELEIVWATKQ